MRTDRGLIEFKVHYTFSKHVYEYMFLCHTETLKDRNNYSQVEGEQSDSQEGSASLLGLETTIRKFGLWSPAPYSVFYLPCSLSHLCTGVQGGGRKNSAPIGQGVGSFHEAASGDRLGFCMQGGCPQWREDSVWSGTVLADT